MLKILKKYNLIKINKNDKIPNHNTKKNDQSGIEGFQKITSYYKYLK